MEEMLPDGYTRLRDLPKSLLKETSKKIMVKYFDKYPSEEELEKLWHLTCLWNERISEC